MDFGALAALAANAARRFLPAKVQEVIQAVPEVADAVRSVGPLISSFKDFATPADKADLDRFEAEVMAGLDDTIDRLKGTG